MSWSCGSLARAQESMSLLALTCDQQVGTPASRRTCSSRPRCQSSVLGAALLMVRLVASTCSAWSFLIWVRGSSGIATMPWRSLE